jgi:YtkA-like
MNKMLFLIVTILCSFSIAFAGDETLLQVSAKGLFKVEMTLQGKSLKVGKNTFELFVRDKKGKEVPGAYIIVLPHIYQHGESVLIKGKVTEKGKGHYTVEGLYIEIPGHWVLKVTVKKGDKEDIVNFDFPEVKRES